MKRKPIKSEYRNISGNCENGSINFLTGSKFAAGKGDFTDKDDGILKEAAEGHAENRGAYDCVYAFVEADGRSAVLAVWQMESDHSLL